MTTSYNESRDRLLQRALDFLWGQWTSLGVPGNRIYSGDAIIDPEALLLVTTELGRHDTRLLDLALDWLHAEGKRINLQRLKGMRSAIRLGDDGVLGGISEILSEQSTLRKWAAVLPGPGKDKGEGKSTALPAAGFTGGAASADPRFARHGVGYPRWKPRNACMPPSPGRRENLLLTLRSFFGVNARAEIMAWLLTHASGHPAAIARDTGYFSKSIQATLNEMESSGLILAERVGREKHFRLRKHDWMGLLGFPDATPAPRWVAWPWVYYLIHRTLMLMAESGPEERSQLLHSILQRDFLDEVAPQLRESGLRAEMSAERAMKGKQLEDAIMRDVERLGELLDGDFRDPAGGTMQGGQPS